MSEVIDKINYGSFNKRVKASSKYKSVRATSVSNITKVMHSYFKIVFDDILKGNTWVFPNGFGVLKIIKIDHSKTSSRKLNKKKYFEEGKKEMCFNVRTIGYHCQYKFDSEVLKRYGFKFKPSLSLRTELKNLLLSQDNNFRYE